MDEANRHGVEALRLVELTKGFGDPRGGRVMAVDHLTLEVAPAEFVVLLGPSGCGKTTILRLVAGFEEPTVGEVYLGTRRLTGLLPNRRNIGFVFQNYALFPHLTVLQNVAYGLEAHGVPPRERHHRITDALDLVGLGGLEARYPHQLSGGQQQRVAIARAVVLEPKVLLFDEPLSNLDAKLRVQTRVELRALQRRLSITTLYVTHDQDEAMYLADRIAILDKGHLIQMGTSEVLYRHPATRFVAEFLGHATFVPAEVLAVDPRRTVVRTLGTVLELTDGHSTVHPGTTVALGIRSEAVRLVTEKREGAVPGTVTRFAFLGGHLEYMVEISGVRLAAVMPQGSAPRLGEGAAVWVEIDPHGVVLLP
jgi:iron(III) transport system ATP-binding protein